MFTADAVRSPILIKTSISFPSPGSAVYYLLWAGNSLRVLTIVKGLRRGGRSPEPAVHSDQNPIFRFYSYIQQKLMNYWQRFDYDTSYHIYNKTPDHRKLFLDQEDYIRFLEKFKEYFENYVILFGYCLIPNHFHFLIRVRPSEDFTEELILKENSKAGTSFLLNPVDPHDFLINQLKRWLSSTALYLNKKYKVSGQVFLEKTKRISILSENKFLDLLCYIHHNPIHHFLVKNFEDWSYSSYMDYSETILEPGPEEILRHLGHSDLIEGKKYFTEMHRLYKEQFDWDDYKINSNK